MKIYFGDGMKKGKNLIAVLCASLMVIAILSGFKPVQGDTPVALIKKIVLDVTFRPSGESDWETAKTGEPLLDGQEVRTGDKSLALVLFTDGSGLLRVRENSILHVYGKTQEHRLNKDTFVQKGTVGFEVNKQESEEFKFTTPTAVASIRGTEGFVGVNDSTTLVAVGKGLVDVLATLGQKQSGSVPAGSVAQVGQDGVVNIYQMTDEQLKTLQDAGKTHTKKLKIDIKDGVVEIEYFTD